MSTFVVSLHLPYTVNFHDAKKERPPPRPTPKRMITRAGSSLDIREITGRTASLLDGPTTPVTPAAQSKAEMLSRFGLDDQDPHKHSYKPGDPKAFVRNDAHVPDWGLARFLNQPKSRADSFISNSILDYNNTNAEIQDGNVRGYAQPHTNLSHYGKSKTSCQAGKDRGFENSIWTVEPAIQGNGGLTNAIRSTSYDQDYHKIFVGTLGFPTDALPKNMKDDIHERLENEYDALVTYVSDRDFSGHYSHFCKTILWPIFHYQLPDHPKSKAYEDHSWKYYKALNQAFADKVVASYKQGDIIWIHDYHLLLVPGMVRDKLPDVQIGFFLHTAFPSSEIFRCLAKRKELLEGMLGANLIAFQVREYAQHFLQTCSRLLVVEVTGDGVQLDDRLVNVTSQPLGIDPEALAKARQEADVKEWIDVLKEKYKGKKLIVARDKLDHVRGVRQKLLAFELFLNKNPEWRNNCVLLQVATSTTENSELLATVADITARIDAQFSTLAHQPVMFLMQDMSFSQYVALLSVANVLMISSLREGMGLTAHEFVFCQDGALSEQKHGPVILSEFTGSAAIFGGNELSINPWDYQQTANAIKTALEMGDAEKKTRHDKLRSVIMHHTGGYWAKQLQTGLEKFFQEQSQRNQLSIPRLDFRDLAEKYQSSQRRLFLLDSEGTLSSYGPDRNVFAKSQAPIFDTLNDLLSDRKNIVYVMSSRTPEELQRLFAHVPTVGLVAENGCFVREYGSRDNDWISFTDREKVQSWKNDVNRVLQYYADRIEGSRIEQRHCSLVLHYQKAEDPESAQSQAGDCINHINDACDAHRIHAVPIGRSLLIEGQDNTKATAADSMFNSLAQNQNPGTEKPEIDFIMTAGDDREDEVVFRWANELHRDGKVKNVTTVSMGRRNTEAKSTLTQGPTGLLHALQKLANLSNSGTEPDYFQQSSRNSSSTRSVQGSGGGSSNAANLYRHH